MDNRSSQITQAPLPSVVVFQSWIQLHQAHGVERCSVRQVSPTFRINPDPLTSARGCGPQVQTAGWGNCRLCTVEVVIRQAVVEIAAPRPTAKLNCVALKPSFIPAPPAVHRFPSSQLSFDLATANCFVGAAICIAGHNLELALRDSIREGNRIGKSIRKGTEEQNASGTDDREELHIDDRGMARS